MNNENNNQNNLNIPNSGIQGNIPNNNPQSNVTNNLSNTPQTIQNDGIGEYIDVNSEREKIGNMLSQMEKEKKNELEQTISGEQKLNEAGKKEVRVKVDTTVTRVHKKDKVRATLLMIILVFAPLFFLARAIFNGYGENKEEVFVIKVTKSAEKYMASDSQSALMYAFIMGDIQNYYLFVSDLVEEGYIDYNLVNPKTKENMNNSVIYVYMQDGELQYHFPYTSEIEKMELIRGAKRYVQSNSQSKAINALKNGTIKKITVSAEELNTRDLLDFEMKNLKDAVVEITYKYNKLLYDVK